MSTFNSRDAQWTKLYNELVQGTPSQASTTPTTQDYLVDRRNQLINEARANRFLNTMNSTVAGGNNNVTPTTTTTNNTSAYYWWYYGNPRPAVDLQNSIIENGRVVYNPANWNWWYDNYIGRGTNNNTQTYTPFSVADTLKQRADGYQAQGLEWLANSYRTLNRENNIYNNTANKIADYYSALANDINSRENALAQRKESLANQLSQDIANQRQYVMDYFGPNWIFTNEVNRFYDENGNYLASEAGRQMAMANAEWIQSGASLWAQRAARNEAYNNAFQNYLKVKEQEITAKMNIQTQLINYMKALREEYGNTQNQFVISQYERANDLLNALSTNLAQTQSNIATARLQQATAWWGRQTPSQFAIIAEAWEAVANWTATPEQKAIAAAYGIKYKWVPWYERTANWYQYTDKHHQVVDYDSLWGLWLWWGASEEKQEAGTPGTSAEK